MEGVVTPLRPFVGAPGAEATTAGGTMAKEPRDSEADAPAASPAPNDPVVLTKSAAPFDPGLAAKAVHFTQKLDAALRAPDDDAPRPANPGQER
jgi:hypothetical protein